MAKSSNLAAAVAAFRECLSGAVYVPGEDGYQDAVTLWNGAVTKKPAVIARCQDENDVSVAVKLSKDFDLPLSVKGGGHDWGGRALIDDGLVIDLSLFKGIDINLETRRAVVGGGVLAGELVDAADPHGLVPVVGTARDVGICGFSLGGGYGPFVNRFGLGADNIIAARVVLPNGDIVTASSDEHPDLYWGLRGGGGNFGVVTELTLQLHRQPEILTGIMLYPWQDCAAFLDGFAAITAEGHDDLSVLVILLTADDGNPAPVVFATWTGDPDVGRPVLERFAALGNPSFNEIKPMTLAQFLAVFRVGERHHHFMRNRWTPNFDVSLRDLVIEATERRPAEKHYIVLHHFGGQAAQVPATATAFGRREEHYLIEVIACWPPEDDARREIHADWVRQYESRIDPFALPGGYANLLGPEEVAHYSHAYGDNARKLRQIKDIYDPDGRFTSTLLIP